MKHVNECDGMHVNGKYVARGKSMNGSLYKKYLKYSIQHQAGRIYVRKKML